MNSIILMLFGLFKIINSEDIMKINKTNTIITPTNSEDILLNSINQEPFFDNTTQRDIVAAVGRIAEFHCKVKNLGDKSVSWIRKRDLHILTIGVMTYTNDQRFQALRLDDTDEWVLKIVSVQPRDSGIYECQVSTEPKISQAYQLHVAVSKAKILANSELYFKSGSNINLTCIAQHAPNEPTYIYWYKDSELINNSDRGGISILTEYLTKQSKLEIANVLPSDSGNYTCIPSNSNSDSVFVHVIKNEHRAAMQHEHASTLHVPVTIIRIFGFYYINCMLIQIKILAIIQYLLQRLVYLLTTIKLKYFYNTKKKLNQQTTKNIRNDIICR
ncbi:protein amalgam-like [Condylostylus longicornis]|uniref:protein amalgam-like n=1 Tax=Condylostylus longicornis TaxID=2530218 RepID=UPI00244DCBDF|nr:protein amalgam-like [Condylostylus longicornis]